MGISHDSSMDTLDTKRKIFIGKQQKGRTRQRDPKAY